MQKIFLFFILMLGAPLLVSAADSLPAIPPDQVVARVNGVELRGVTLNDYVDAVLPDLGIHGHVPPDKINFYRREALDRLILHELIYQDALRRHIRISASRVDAEIARTRARFRSQAVFEKALAKRGLTLESLRSITERNLLVAEVVRRDITNHAQVSDAEIGDYYQKNLAHFREPESLQVRHIFIPPGPDAGRQAEEIRQKAQAKNTSEEFDRLARTNSKDDYRVMGGMLGWVHKGRLEPELEAAAFALRPGEVSPVIETSTGFHLLHLEGKRAERQVPLAEAREGIRTRLVESKTDVLRQQLRARVYKGAKVEILTKL